MLSGATRGGGGRALGAHLADRKDENVLTEMGETRHLGAATIEEALRELDEGAAHGRTRQHAYHLHADPAPGERWHEATWSDWWDRLEHRLGLEDAPFVEARHTTWREAPAGADLDRLRDVHGADAVRLREEDGRAEVLIQHRHRVYSRVREDGSVVPLRHDYAAREAVARQIEHDHGFDLRVGGHNRSVAAAMRREGRHDVAEAMQAAGLVEAPRPVADLSPRARAQQERTGVPQADVDRRILAAWRAGDSPQAKAAALRDAGLTPVMGTKGPGVLDEAGGFHLLTKAVGRASKAQGERIGAAEVRAALEGLELTRHDPEVGRRPAPPLEAPQPVETEKAAPGAEEHSQEELLSPTVAPEPVAVSPSPTVETPPVEAAAPDPSEAPAPAADSGVSAPAPAGAPKDGGRAPSAGGGGGSEAPEGDTIAALDPSKPDDVSRFLRDFARVMQRRAAQATAAAEQSGKGKTDVSGKQPDYDWLVERLEYLREQFGRAVARGSVEDASAAYRAAVAELEGRPGAEGKALDARADPRSAGRHDRPADPPGGGPEGRRSDAVRGADGSAEQRRPAGAAGAVGAEGRGVEDGGTPRAAGARGGEPAHARHTIEPHRITAGLARVEDGRREIDLRAHPDRLARLAQLGRLLTEQQHASSPQMRERMRGAGTRLRDEFQVARTDLQAIEKARWRSALDTQRQAAELLRNAVAQGRGHLSPSTRQAARATLHASRERITQRLRETKPEPLTWERFLAQRAAAGDRDAMGLHDLTVLRRERQERLQAALAASKQRVGAVLEQQPWRDPASRDSRALDLAGHEQVMQEMRSRDAAADAARQRAEEAHRRVGIVSRALGGLGIATASARRADAALDALEQAEAGRIGRRELDEKLRGAAASAKATARERQHEHDAWEDRPDARAARREELGNRLVEDAIGRGDREIQRLVTQDLDRAREEVLRRHDDELRHQLEARRKAEEERMRREREERMKGYEGGRGPSPGPRR